MHLSKRVKAGGMKLKKMKESYYGAKAKYTFILVIGRPFANKLNTSTHRNRCLHTYETCALGRRPSQAGQLSYKNT